MTKVNKDILYTDFFGEIVPLPQFERKSDGTQQVVKGEVAPFMQPVGPDGNPLFSTTNPANVQMAGNTVVEQKTQTDASAGKVTFSKNIYTLEIYNVDSTNQGVFTVNGIKITVPPGQVFKSSFGGTPTADVTVTGSTSYILTRYE